MAGGSDGDQNTEVNRDPNETQNVDSESNQQIGELNAALQLQVQHSNVLQRELNTLRDEMTDFFTNQNRPTTNRPAPPIPNEQHLARQDTHENLDQIEPIRIPLEVNAITDNQIGQNLGARPRTTNNVSNFRSRNRSNSRSRSRANSRQASPDNLTGVVPLTYDALKAMKIILQGKTDEYEDALCDLRSHTAEPNSIYRRIKAEHAAIERKTQEKIAEELPKVLGLHRISPAAKIKFITVPQDEENKQLGSTCQREFTKGNPIRLKGKSPNVRYVIEALRNRYDGLLSHKQIQQILVDLSDSNFKDVVTNAFDVSDTNQAIQHLLENYGEMHDDVQLASQFYNARLDMKNLEESMIMILEQARQCFKNLTREAINDKAIEKILHALPRNSVNVIQEKMKQTERLRKWNDSVEPVDFNTFMKYVTDNVSQDQPKRQIRPIQVISEMKNNDTDNQYSTDPLDRVTDKLINAIKSLESQNRPNQSSSGKSYAKSAMQYIQKNQKEYRDAIREFEINGTLLGLIKKISDYNATKRRRNWPLKRTSNPNQPVNYEYDSEGKIIPSTNKIDFPTVVKSPRGKYFLSDRIMERISKVCYKCGHADCGANNVNCIYKDTTEVFSPCSLCNQGFHPDHSCAAAADDN